MSVKHSTTTWGNITREITWNSKTGESTRPSESAKSHVDNGKHSSMAGAKEEGARDIARGPRKEGDTSYRGSKTSWW